jgi:hypothetical protein
VPSQPSIGRGGLEPERCGSPFLFDRVKKLAFEHEGRRSAIGPSMVTTGDDSHARPKPLLEPPKPVYAVGSLEWEREQAAKESN